MVWSTASYRRSRKDSIDLVEIRSLVSSYGMEVGDDLHRPFRGTFDAIMKDSRRGEGRVMMENAGITGMMGTREAAVRSCVCNDGNPPSSIAGMGTTCYSMDQQVSHVHMMRRRPLKMGRVLKTSPLCSLAIRALSLTTNQTCAMDNGRLPA